MTMAVGSQGSAELTVSSADTASAVGSGDVPVLATPRVLALAEAATVAAVMPLLARGETTVGTRVELDHLVATPVGHHVLARATLTRADGRRLEFEVSVLDGDVIVARGRVHRTVVDRHRFLARLT
jgi:fluoroacetyl-CoA thioesterase